MEELKINISKILLDSLKVDWFIIHKISKDKLNIEGIGFSFVNGIERIDEPFKSNLGYISLKNPSIISEFGILIAELLQEFKFNPIALANIFIITTRVSYSGSDKEILIENFKKTIGTKKSNNTFSILTDSLNAEYYKHHHLKDSKPKNTNE